MTPQRELHDFEQYSNSSTTDEKEEYPGTFTLVGDTTLFKPLVKPFKKVFDGDPIHLSFSEDKLDVEHMSVAYIGTIQADIPKETFTVYRQPQIQEDVIVNGSQLYDALKGASLRSNPRIKLTTSYSPTDPDDLFSRGDDPENDWLYVLIDSDDGYRCTGYAHIYEENNDNIDDPEIPDLGNPITAGEINAASFARTLRGYKKYGKNHHDSILSRQFLFIGTDTTTDEWLIHNETSVTDEDDVEYKHTDTSPDEPNDSFFHANLGTATGSTPHISPYSPEYLLSLTQSIRSRGSTPLNIRQYCNENTDTSISLLQVTYPLIGQKPLPTISLFLSPRVLSNDFPFDCENPPTYEKPTEQLSVTATKGEIAPIINTLSSLTDKTTIAHSDNQAVTKTANNKNTALIDITLEDTYFSEYSTPEETPTEIGASFNLFSDLLRGATKTQSIALTFGQSYQTYTLENLYTVQIPSPATESVIDAPELPDISYPVNFTLDMSEFATSISEASDVTEHITVGSANETAFIIADGTSDQTVSVFDVDPTATATQEYSNDLLEKACNGLSPLANSIKVYLKEESNITLSIQSDNLEAEYMIAPRIANEKETTYRIRHAEDYHLTTSQAEILKTELPDEHIVSQLPSSPR